MVAVAPLAASARHETHAKPFVKWVGGKRQILERLLARKPKSFKTYHEPFVGGGALFFALRPKRAYLSDVNERLIRTYQGVRDRADEVISLLGSYPHDRDVYLNLRGQDIDREGDAKVAAWFIYLNRTGYNGLYRVNRRNQFNVPFGSYQNPMICDVDNLLACSRALAAAKIHHGPFDGVLQRAKPGDFVYFDPPYIPLSVSSSFTSYTSDGFGMEEQRRLRDVAIELRSRGVHVLLSNSSAPAVVELYQEHFTIEEVDASRSVNCKSEKRGKIKELVIHS